MLVLAATRLTNLKIEDLCINTDSHWLNHHPRIPSSLGSRMGMLLLPLIVFGLHLSSAAGILMNLSCQRIQVFFILPNSLTLIPVKTNPIMTNFSVGFLQADISSSISSVLKAKSFDD